MRNPEEHVGKRYEFRILKINLERKNIVVSRRDLIEESRRESRRKVWPKFRWVRCVKVLRKISPTLVRLLI